MNTTNPPRRLFRSRVERAADKAAALVRKEQAVLEAQRARDQREQERIKAKQDKQRLRSEKTSDPARDVGDDRKTDLLTRAAALIATIVAGQGMWQFLGTILGDIPWPLRALMFAFLEIAVITSAIRARSNMRKNFSAGIDGIAVWALTGASAFLAAMEARSLPEAVFRLLAPLVAAWLWERGMAIERRRIRGTSGVNWRLTPERVLVWLGVAEANDRTASEVDAFRRITRVALAAKRARALEAAGEKEGKRRRARARLDRALERAIEHTDLSRDPERMRQMLDQIGSLYASGSLLALPEIAPWSALDHPMIRPALPVAEAGTPAALLEGEMPVDVPGGPAPAPAEALPYGPVPDELCPVAVARYSEDLDAGRAPSLRRIKDDLRIGQPRAERIQAYLTQLARTWPSGAQAPAEYVPATAAMFHEPTVNGSTSAHAAAIPMTSVEVS